MYGITDATRQANAAHVKSKPGPRDTTMPSGTDWSPECECTGRSLMFAALWMITVQILAPINNNRLPAIAKRVETRNVILCLATPLYCL